MSSEFKREERYVVIKIKDLELNSPSGDKNKRSKELGEWISRNSLRTRECVVVESDWPEYHLVWAMIEHRIAGKPVPNFNDWRRADELQQRLTAADERVDVLEVALRKIKARLDAYSEADMRMPESSVEVCQMIADAALKPTAGSTLSTCTWSEGGFSWRTGCGKEWQFTDGGLPSENGMRFCHSCGKTLVVGEDQPESERES